MEDTLKQWLKEIEKKNKSSQTSTRINNQAGSRINTESRTLYRTPKSDSMSDFLKWTKQLSELDNSTFKKFHDTFYPQDLYRKQRKEAEERANRIYSNYQMNRQNPMGQRLQPGNQMKQELERIGTKTTDTEPAGFKDWSMRQNVMDTGSRFSQTLQKMDPKEQDYWAGVRQREQEAEEERIRQAQEEAIAAYKKQLERKGTAQRIQGSNPVTGLQAGQQKRSSLQAGAQQQAKADIVGRKQDNSLYMPETRGHETDARLNMPARKQNTQQAPATKPMSWAEVTQQRNGTAAQQETSLIDRLLAKRPDPSGDYTITHSRNKDTYTHDTTGMSNTAKALIQYTQNEIDKGSDEKSIYQVLAGTLSDTLNYPDAGTAMTEAGPVIRDMIEKRNGSKTYRQYERPMDELMKWTNLENPESGASRTIREFEQKQKEKAKNDFLMTLRTTADQDIMSKAYGNLGSWMGGMTEEVRNALNPTNAKNYIADYAEAKKEGLFNDGGDIEMMNRAGRNQKRRELENENRFLLQMQMENLDKQMQEEQAYRDRIFRLDRIEDLEEVLGEDYRKFIEEMKKPENREKAENLLDMTRSSLDDFTIYDYREMLLQESAEKDKERLNKYNYAKGKIEDNQRLLDEIDRLNKQDERYTNLMDPATRQGSEEILQREYDELNAEYDRMRADGKYTPDDLSEMWNKVEQKREELEEVTRFKDLQINGKADNQYHPEYDKGHELFSMKELDEGVKLADAHRIYSFINGGTEYETWQQGKNSIITNEYNGASMMLQEEVQRFNELYNAAVSEGREPTEAMAFIDALQPYLNERYRDFEKLQNESTASRLPVLSSMASLGISAAGPYLALATEAGRFLGNPEAQDSNSRLLAGARTQEDIEGRIAQNLGPIGGLPYKAVMSGLKNYVRGLTSMGFGKAKSAVNLAEFAGEAFYTSYQEKLEETHGNSDAAATYAMVDAGISTLFEVASVEKMFSDPTDMVEYVLKNMGAEMSEELFEGIFGPYIHQVMDGENGINARRDQILYRDHGYEDENGNWVEVTAENADEAMWQAAKEHRKEIIESVASAALSAGGPALFGMTRNAMDENRQNKKTGKQILNEGITKGMTTLQKSGIRVDNALKIVNPALQMNDGEAKSLAERIKNDIDNKKEINPKDLGRLVRAITNEAGQKIGEIAQNQLGEDFLRYLKKAGVKRKDAALQTQALLRAVMDPLNISGQDYFIINKSEAAMTLLKEFRDSEARQEYLEKTKGERAAIKSVMEVITGESFEGVSAEDAAGIMDGAEEASAEEIAEADQKGTRTGGAAEVLADGEYAEITGFERTKVRNPETNRNETRLTVKLNNGKTIDIANVKGLNKQQAQVLKFISSDRGLIMGTNTAMALLNAAKNVKTNTASIASDTMRILWSEELGESAPKTNLDEQAEASIRDAVRADIAAAEEERLKNGTEIRAGQGTTTINGAEFGTKAFQQQISKMGRQIQNEANVIGKIAKAAGLQVELYYDENDSGNQGSYTGGRGIRINLAGTYNTEGVHRSAVATFAHEITHNLEANSAEAYKALRSFVLQNLQNSGKNVKSELRNIMDSYAAHGEEIDLHGAIAEMVAKASEQVLTSEKVVRELYDTDRKTFGAVQKAVQRVISQMRRVLGDTRDTSSRYAKAMSNVMNGMEKVWVAAYKEAAGEKQTGKALQADQDAFDGTETHYGDHEQFSLRVTDKDELDFLNNQKYVTTYKSMQLIDGKLYPPMAAVVAGSMEDYSELGQWEKATEHPELIKAGNKFTLNKGKGQGSIAAAYNPYMHSSNLMINDQFSGAYNRPNLVTVECRVPVSELTSGYHAENAKDSVGWHSWHTGPVASQMRNHKGQERQVMLSRWIQPMRIVPDAEVAQHYKELLDGTDIAVPDNVITPSLKKELIKAGVKVQESGRVQKSFREDDKTKTEGSHSGLSANDNGKERTGNPSDKNSINEAGTSVNTDKEYEEAVKRGDLKKATQMLMDKLSETDDIIPFIAPHWDAGKDRQIARLIKDGVQEAIATAAADMAEHVPENAVLIPMPDHTGQVTENTDTMILANAISKLTGRPVVAALEGVYHESRHEAKARDEKGASQEELGFRQAKELPEGTFPVFVDNMVGSGITADAARKAIGGGITLAYTKTARSKGIKGLKNVVVTYDKNKNLIPLSQRFDINKRDVRYSFQEDNDYMAAVESGDMETAQRIVDEAARREGYTEKAFHGTDSFGFTKFDLERSGQAIFVAYSEDVAGTYTYGDRREIGKERIKEINLYDMTDDEVAKYIEENPKKFFPYYESIKAEKAKDRYGFDKIKITYTVPADNDPLFGDPTPEETGEFYTDREELTGILEEDEISNPGIYDLYVNPERQLVVDAKGAEWNEITPDWDDKHADSGVTLTTREIGNYAKNHGYYSVRINNVYDSGHNYDHEKGYGDIGIFFHEGLVKSADTVTYDDDGNEIPPSERFKLKNQDIRYSFRDETDVDVRAWMDNLNESSLQTEAEKKLLENYKGLRMRVRLKQEQERKIKAEISNLQGVLNGAEGTEGTGTVESMENALEGIGIFTKNGKDLIKDDYFIGQIIGRNKIRLNQGNTLADVTNVKNAGFVYDKLTNTYSYTNKGKKAMGHTDIEKRIDALQKRLESTTKEKETAEEQLAEITGSKGYATMMYRERKVISDNIEGKTQEEVRAIINRMEKSIDTITKRIEANQKTVDEMEKTGIVAKFRELLGTTTAEKTAAELKKKYNSTWTKAQIRDYLDPIILKMKTGEDFTQDVEALAGILVNSDSTNTYEELGALRGLTITLGKGAQQELRAQNSSLKEVRARLAGTGITVKFGDRSTLEADIESLREEFPGMPEMGDEKDALGNFLDWIDGMKQQSAASEFYDQKIAEAMAVVTQSAAGAAKGIYMPTDPKAQKQVLALMEFVKSLNAETQEAQKMLQAVAEELAELQKAGKRASGLAGSMEHDANAMVKYYNRMAKIAEDTAKKKTRKDIIAQLKSEHAQKILKNNEEWRNLIERDKNARAQAEENRKYRSKINTVAKRMYSLLKNPQGTKNIPEHMQGLARYVVERIVNNDLGGSKVTLISKKELEEAQRVLYAWKMRDGAYNRDDLLAMEDNFGAMIAHQDVLYLDDWLMEMNADYKGKSKLDILQQRGEWLQKIQEAVSEIWSFIKAEGEIALKDRKIAIEDAAYKVAQETKKSRFKGERTGATRGIRNFMHKAIISGNMTPEYFFRTIGNAGMTDLWDEYHRAENRNGLELAKAQKRLAEIAKRHGYNTWDTKQTITVHLEDGDVKMTLGQIMSLWATWKREQMLGPEMSEHLTKGGFYVEQNLEDGFAGREKIRKRAVKVTEEDMDMVRNLLTDAQRRYVDDVVLYMSRDMSQLGNEASMKAYGIKLYKEKYYFPFQMWDGVRSRKSNDAGQGASGNQAFHPSFSKTRMHGANNAVVLGDFTQTAADHIVGMINYATMGLANENLNKVLNQQTSEETYGTKRNVRAIFEEAYGQEALKYLMDLKVQLEGGAVRIEKTAYDKMITAFRKNAVAGSMSVAMQQPLSYIRAAMMIDMRYLARALSPDVWKGSYQEMLDHSGVAVIKEMGRFDMNAGQSAREYLMPEAKQGKARKAWDKTTEIATILPELMDRMTWTRMWSACKAEQMALHPEMDANSNEFLDMVGERFNDLMRRTQVYDSVLVKSANMRNQNPFMKSITSFMAEPTLTANVLADSVRMAIKGEKGGKLQAVKAGSIFLISAVLQAAVKAGWGTGRSPDEKKNGLENFLYKFWSNLIGEVDPLTLIPGYSYIIDAMKGTDITDNAWGTLTKVISAGQTGIDALLGNKSRGAYRDIEDSVAQLVQIFTKMPAKNLMRDGRAMYNWITGASESSSPYAWRQTSGNVLKYQGLDLIHSADNLIGVINQYMGKAGYDTSSKAYYKRAYEAAKAGNEGRKTELIDYLLNGKGVKESTITSNLNTLAKADETLTSAERVDFLLKNGYKSTASYITEEYEKGKLGRKEAEDLYRKANPKATDKKILETFDKKDYENAGGDPEGYGNYTILYNAIDAGDEKAAKERIKYMTENGFTEKEILKEVKSHIKEQYKDKEIDRKTAEGMYKKYAPEMTEADISKALDEIDYEAKTGKSVDNYSDYMPLYDAIDAGNSAEAKREAERLKGLGYKAEEIESKAASHIVGQYKAGDITRSAAEKNMKASCGSMTADDIWWKLDRVDYQKETGKDVSNEKYYRLWNAMDNNRADDIGKAITEMTKHGVDAKNIKSQISGRYKEDYLTGSSADKRRIRDAMQKAYRKLGFTAEDADKAIEGWTKTKKKK